MSLSLTDRMCVLFSSRKSGGQSFVHKCFWKNSVKHWFSTYKAFNLCCEDQPSSGRWRIPCVSRLVAVFTVSLLRHVSRVLSANGSSSWNLVLAKSIFMFWLIQTILVVCRVFFKFFSWSRGCQGYCVLPNQQALNTKWADATVDS